MLAACSSGEKAAEPTASPTPTLFVATPTAAGIANPPQTAQAGAGTATPRTRAEAFLRRIAPTDADVPAGFTAQPPTAQDPASLGPAGAMAVLTHTSSFDGPSDGAIRGVRHTGYAFTDVPAAQQGFREIAASLPAAARDTIHLPNPMVEVMDGLQLGEERAAWRASAPAQGSGGAEPVVWAVAVRRGAAVVTLLVSGTDAAPETFGQELAQRLDQRTAAALPTAWP
ncbi:MAG: hypothetical protein ACRDJE_10085 [Dehalococcoidia bacterium]